MPQNFLCVVNVKPKILDIFVFHLLNMDCRVHKPVALESYLLQDMVHP